ncbi:MAG TPA: TldD/PmbA family protein, partial [Trueperaceae bacterium]|nr:TldD/PmbA family protein [Trueperaceae bacterium]
MLSTDTLSAIIARGRSAGADFAEVYAERWRKRGIRAVNGQVEDATSVVQRGAGIRLFFGHDVLYGFTNDLTDAGLREVLDSLVAVRGSGGNGRPDAAGKGGLDLRRLDTGPDLPGPKVAPDAHDKRWRLERLREADAGARIDPAISQVEANLNEIEQEVLVANSDGVIATDDRTRTRLVVQAIAREGDQTQTAHVGPGLSVGLELLDMYRPAETGRRAAEIALTNLRARKAPAGTMPVVVGNAFGGVIFHEALGHLLETTAVARNASVLTDKLGEQIASPAVTYV